MILALTLFFAANEPKNIKVLTDIQRPQLIPAMAFMANSLGVTCSYCHTAQWESDDKPAKTAARRMIVMQRAINEQQYGGKLTVTCNTCHQGKPVPPATPDVANAGWNDHPATPAPVSISGEEAASRLPQTAATKRVVRGTVERYNGRDAPKSAPFTLTLERGAAPKYDTELSHPPEAMRALALYLVEAVPPEKLHGERWTFTNGAIIRERETPTPLGTLPERIEYGDLRGGLPYRARWMRADYRVTFTVDAIE
jgi:hypothetical protein